VIRKYWKKRERVKRGVSAFPAFPLALFTLCKVSGKFRFFTLSPKRLKECDSKILEKEGKS
jgi:hypothetical protein